MKRSSVWGTSTFMDTGTIAASNARLVISNSITPAPSWMVGLWSQMKSRMDGQRFSFWFTDCALAPAAANNARTGSKTRIFNKLPVLKVLDMVMEPFSLAT